MEQARYWMWAKRKPDLNPHITPSSAAAMSSSYGDSWEEQAFAEDAAGTLGGCVWPPRSYSCSFCRREFRSAQALGGHMNVHRRDRARLKQSPIPAAPSTDHVAVPQNHALNSSTYDPPVLYQSPRTSTFLYNNNNPEFSSSFSHVIRVSSPPSAKVTSIGDDQDTNISTLSFFSSLVQKNGKGNIVISSNDPPSSWSSFVAGKKRDRDLDLINKEEKKSKVVVVEPEDKSRPEKEDCVTEDLATNLNLVVCRRQTSSSYDDEEVAISCKRRRIDTKPLSFVRAIERSCLISQAEVLKLRNSASTAEEVLDLELRLGDAPKVK